eukprot:gene7659-10422_t
MSRVEKRVYSDHISDKNFNWKRSRDDSPIEKQQSGFNDREEGEVFYETSTTKINRYKNNVGNKQNNFAEKYDNVHTVNSISNNIQRSGQEFTVKNNYLPRNNATKSIKTDLTNRQQQDVDIVTSKPEMKTVYLSEETLNRNKKMFSTAILGHLGRAQKKLEQDSDLIQKQTSRIAAVSQKNSDNMKKLLLLQRKQEEEARLKQIVNEKRKKFDAKVKELQGQSLEWQNSIEKSAQLLATVTIPSINWVPKQHNVTTTEMLENRKAEIQELKNKRVLQDKQKISELEHKFNIHNECNTENNNISPESPNSIIIDETIVNPDVLLQNNNEDKDGTDDNDDEKVLDS